MSVLVFLDESKIIDKKRQQTISTVAGVMLTGNTLGDFNRRIWKLKQRFFKCSNMTEFPLKGRLLLNHRSFESYRKLEFCRELFSLCRLMKVKLFANTAIKNGGNQPTDQSLNLNADDMGNDAGCPLIVADLMEKISSCMLEDHPGQLAALVFGQEKSMTNLKLQKAIIRLIYFTPLGRGLDGILGSPMTVHPVLSPGLQLADVTAYIVSQFHNGRTQLRDFYHELESLQYISQFDKDEFDLRGMNSFRMD